MDSATIRVSSSSCSSSPSSCFSKLRNPNPSPNSISSRLNFTFFKSFNRIQTPSPDFTASHSSPLKSKRRNPRSSSLLFPCCVATSPPSRTSDLAISKLERLVAEFESLSEPIDRVKRLLHYASLLSPTDDSLRRDSNRVMGCTAQVWLEARMDGDGKMRFRADSDSEITKGFCSCLIWVLDGAEPEEVLNLKTEDLMALSVAGLQGRSNSRVNTWHNVLIGMQKRTKGLVAESEGKPPGEPFPSLVITADGIHAKGSYAEAQARFLLPDELKIQELINVLSEKRIGVVAHFYMDPEVQGVLTAAQKHWPHIHISDSLVMADMAVKMAKAGCQYITVLGVDFMSENVRAILDQAGFSEVGVYRMSSERIGCSLADAASNPAYMDYLEAASLASPSLHVVYINTSLETKANAHELVPTITCTSSNVVQTILQAFAQVPGLNVWYGPDTYMGANIVELFQQMTVMTDDEIAEIHPEHNQDTIRSLLPRLHYYQDGTCMVHHLFGHEVVEQIKEMYCDAFVTAHFEVPGEMFSLAMEAKKRGMGVVGSTQTILDFITNRVQEALDRNVNDHLQFILGTESGMVTSIVAAVRRLLGSGRAKVNVEIVFPVSSDSVTRTPSDSSSGLISGEVGNFMEVPIIPGVASGEGCSIHGGCASCPYMKMNSFSSLLKVCHHLPEHKHGLLAYEAARLNLQTRHGKLIADVGCEPILHMRHFQAAKSLPEKLIYQIVHPCGNGKSTAFS
ncbi:quinolinate synthase, chloroplastic-like [Actinidia eriantha]|uniref:quinolinate synthase, chloroplastic-like n=1 Tax=Actinidia eriantha TaxID=165200 RepID=UPI00258C7D73|nr:quinolinate synthase, chloroplastic-like [Actinidia eriantha]